MVRSYLIENRICFKSDGGSSSGGGDDGGSAADRARASATPAQTDVRGRPLVRGTTNVIDTSRQILPPDDDGPNIPPPTQVEFGRGRADLSPPTPAPTAVAGQNQRPSGTL
jgi:hypothetical protein